MEVSLAVAGDPAGDVTRVLYQWLVEDDDLRGSVRLVQQSPQLGVLGPELVGLLVTLGPVTTTALASALVAFIRHRAGNQTVTMTRPDGARVELSATHVRGLNADGVGRLVAQLARSMDAPGVAAAAGSAQVDGDEGGADGQSPDRVS